MTTEPKGLIWDRRGGAGIGLPPVRLARMLTRCIMLSSSKPGLTFAFVPRIYLASKGSRANTSACTQRIAHEHAVDVCGGDRSASGPGRGCGKQDYDGRGHAMEVKGSFSVVAAAEKDAGRLCLTNWWMTRVLLRVWAGAGASVAASTTSSCTTAVAFPCNVCFRE